MSSMLFRFLSFRSVPLPRNGRAFAQIVVYFNKIQNFCPRQLRRPLPLLCRSHLTPVPSWNNLNIFKFLWIPSSPELGKSQAHARILSPIKIENFKPPQIPRSFPILLSLEWIPSEEFAMFRFFYLRTLTAAMMVRRVPPVLPRSFPRFWKKLEKNQFSDEFPDFGRSRKMSYEKASKKNKTEHHYEYLVKLKLFQVQTNHCV